MHVQLSMSSYVSTDTPKICQIVDFDLEVQERVVNVL